MEILIIPVATVMIILGFALGSSIQEPRFVCLDCDHEIRHGVEFCEKCGDQKSWGGIEKSDAALPIFMGAWRIKI
jgi:hypothetical protein